MSTRPHVRHHVRFLVAAVAGFLTWLLSGGVPFAFRAIVAGDVFFIVYLAAMMRVMIGTTPEALRAAADDEDEGIALIAVLTFLAVGFSLGSILTVLNANSGPHGVWLLLAVASVPLGWLMLHTLASHHYLFLYYAPPDAGGSAPASEAGGLEFPGDAPPVAWDFLYFSFVIGMTAQVSDVVILSPRLRRVVLAHSIASFFFNTVLLAIAVNAAITQAS